MGLIWANAIFMMTPSIPRAADGWHGDPAADGRARIGKNATVLAVDGALGDALEGRSVCGKAMGSLWEVDEDDLARTGWAFHGLDLDADREAEARGPALQIAHALDVCTESDSASRWHGFTQA